LKTKPKDIKPEVKETSPGTFTIDIDDNPSHYRENKPSNTMPIERVATNGIVGWTKQPMPKDKKKD
jgi:hypothetical protein